MRSTPSSTAEAPEEAEIAPEPEDAHGACGFCGEPLKVIEVSLFGKAREVACYGSCGCEMSRQRLERLEPQEKVRHPTTHRCPMCGGSMAIWSFPGYVSACAWCGYECVFKSDLDARREEAMMLGKPLLEGTGVPRLFWDVEPDYARADEMVRGGKGLFITGGTGTAKSLTAAAVAKAYAERGCKVRFVSSVRLLTDFKDAYGTSKPEGVVFDELTGCDLLVIDDLGKENATSWAATMLYSVIDGRYGAMRPLVVTTNYTEGELVAKMAGAYDDTTARAMVSRIVEMTERLVLDGEDRRLA